MENLQVSNFGQEMSMNIDGATTLTGIQLSYPPGMMEMALKAIDEIVPAEMRVAGEPYVAITMPCGEKFIVERREDFPASDVPCSCGNPNHFFIKYEVQREVPVAPFKPGHFYMHEAGRQIAVLGEVASYKWGKMLVIEEADSTGHAISCAEVGQEANENWVEIGRDEWLENFNSKVN